MMNEEYRYEGSGVVSDAFLTEGFKENSPNIKNIKEKMLEAGKSMNENYRIRQDKSTPKKDHLALAMLIIQNGSACRAFALIAGHYELVEFLDDFLLEFVCHESGTFCVFGTRGAPRIARR